MDDRRASPRRPLKPTLACRLAFPTTTDPVPGAALDVSAGGMGLYLVRSPGAPGTALLELLDGPAALRRWLPLRIAYLRPAEDGGHLLGGAFTDPLPDVNLKTLLTGP